MRIKSLLLVFSLLGLAQTSRAQATVTDPREFGTVFRFGCEVTESMRARQITAQSVGITDTDIDHLYKPWILEGKTISKILLGVKLNPKLKDYELSPIRSFSKSFTSYRIDDGSDAIVIAMGINKNNVDEYRYRIVLNDSAEVVPWSKPKLGKNYGAKKPYGFIGRFNYPDQQALVEVVNIKDYQIRDGVMFDWRKSFKPVTTNLMVYAPHLSLDEIRKMSLDSIPGKDQPYQAKHDPITNEITEVSFDQGAVNRLLLILRDHPGIFYDVRLSEENSDEYLTAGEGDPMQATFDFNNLPKQPGRYEIVVRPQVSGGVAIKGQELRIPVIIRPSPYAAKKAAVNQLLPYLIGFVIITLLIFGGYYRRNQVKLVRVAQEKKVASLTLRSIRAQLNPHFMFNALTSIQNLMHKNDTQGADHYLSRFASLTRKVLNTSEQELISLEDEVKILDDYLQMEQLRFNFQYKLNVDPKINAANTEVPAMLLQPFVENAVKHGVANIREKGSIIVNIDQNGKDLVMMIIDNGEGFVKGEPKAEKSFGIKLSEERIKLLNDLYTDEPTSLNIDTGAKGTTVTIKLTNWIS